MLPDLAGPAGTEIYMKEALEQVVELFLAKDRKLEVDEENDDVLIVRPERSFHSQGHGGNSGRQTRQADSQRLQKLMRRHRQQHQPQ